MGDGNLRAVFTYRYTLFMDGFLDASKIGRHTPCRSTTRGILSERANACPAVPGAEGPPRWSNGAAVAASIIDPLKNLGTTISGLPTYQLRQVLASMIASATISMVTREATIALRIPQTAIFDPKTAIETLSLRQTSPSSTAPQAQHDQSLVFARIVCGFYRQGQKPCFKCSRRPAA